MEQEEKKPTTLTGVDLSQTASLLLPWTHDPWGKLRPPLSEEALASPRIRQLSVADVVAETIRRINNEEAVSSLFIE